MLHGEDKGMIKVLNPNGVFMPAMGFFHCFCVICYVKRQNKHDFPAQQ